MHNIDLILTLTGGFVAALTFGYITQRIGISPIIGYLFAGIVVSPHTPGFNADPELAEQLAEVGVILLMFGVGLQFHFKELLAVKRIAVPGAVVQSLTATVLSALILHYGFGWGWPAGVVFGLAVSVASTVVLIRVLADNGDLHTVTGHISVGWLVMEDLFTIFILVLLPAIFGAAATGGELALGLGEVTKATGLASLKIGALVAFTFIVGGWVIPRLLTGIAKTGSRELFTLAVLAIALGIAVGSAKVFGVSMALGAFLAGMVVGRSDFSLRAATEALPMRDAFAVLFFVSVGMLFNWQSLLANPWLVTATMFVILVGKPAAALAIVILMRYPLRVALSVAIVLAQIGEFSFILATMSRQLNIIPESATNAMVASAILSITLNPLTYRLIPRIERGTERLFPGLVRWINKRASGGLAGEAAAAHPIASDKQRAIVVGYGPVASGSKPKACPSFTAMPLASTRSCKRACRMPAPSFSAHQASKMVARSSAKSANSTRTSVSSPALPTCANWKPCAMSAQTGFSPARARSPSRSPSTSCATSARPPNKSTASANASTASYSRRIERPPKRPALPSFLCFRVVAV